MTSLPDSALPAEGELLAVDVAGTAIALARVDGALFAFQDACTHQQCSLAGGELEGRNVVCPCHFGTFDVATGAVLDGPPKAPLRTWAVRAVPGGVELQG